MRLEYLKRKVMDQIRVLHIVPTLGYGGVAKFLLHYYEHIDNNEVCFDFVTHGKVESFHKQLEGNGSHIYYIKPQHELGVWKYYKQLHDILKSEKFDIVHIHLGNYTGLVAMFCKMVGIKKVICHAHTTLAPNPKHRILMPIFRLLARVFADRLFACGQEAGLYCFGKSKFVIIPNGVDLNVFHRCSDEDIQVLKKKLNIDSNALVLGHVGAFVQQKNHIYLISVLEKLIEKEENVVLILVGDGGLCNEIKSLISDKGLIDKVRLVGVQDDIPLYMSLFDVFLLPSLNEGLPVVSAEAQAVGVKCLFSNTIDHSADLGIGCVKFIPITKDALPLWCDAILAPYECPKKELIYQCFMEHNYEIKKAAKYLTKMYKEIVLS